MSRLLWTDEYSVHIRSIDNEHKMLIELLNDIDRDLNIDKPIRRQLVTESLTQLLNHIHAHFESEERFLLLNNYYDYAAHHKEHQELFLRLEEFTREFISGAQEFDEEKMIFLKDWLIRHIILQDCKYGSYFKEKSDLVLPGRATERDDHE